MASVWWQGVDTLDDGMEPGNWRRHGAEGERLNALESDDGARGSFGHDLVVGTQAGERAAGDNAMGSRLEGLPEGVDDEARRMIAFQRDRGAAAAGVRRRRR